MKIKFTLSIIAIVFYSQFILAQNKQISGIVTFADGRNLHDFGRKRLRC